MNMSLDVKIGLYRHFKGEYYFVQNIVKDAVSGELMCYYFNVLHPEYGFFVRRADDWRTMNTDSGPIIDRADNVTGQAHRFEVVESIDNPSRNVTTEQLIEELDRRVDNPLKELDLPHLRDRVFSKDYIIGEKHYETQDFPRGVGTLAVFETPKEAYEHLRRHPSNSDRVSVFKRVFIEL